MVSGLAARRTGLIVGSIRNVSVAALAKNLADTLGPFGGTVNCVHPGTTITEKLPVVWEAQAAPGRDVEEIARRHAAATIANRVVTATGVADIVTFRCWPRAVAINGESIAVGGGMPGPIVYCAMPNRRAALPPRTNAWSGSGRCAIRSVTAATGIGSAIGNGVSEPKSTRSGPTRARR